MLCSSDFQFFHHVDENGDCVTQSDNYVLFIWAYAGFAFMLFTAVPTCAFFVANVIFVKALLQRENAQHSRSRDQTYLVVPIQKNCGGGTYARGRFSYFYEK